MTEIIQNNDNLISNDGNQGFKQEFWLCPDCDFTTKYRTSFERHYYYLHVKNTDKVKIWKCVICSEQFNYKHKYRDHMKFQHNNQKLFNCTKCHFATNYNNSLVRHNRIHESNIIFKCDTCSYSTKHHYELKRHKLTHNKNKTFKCSNCNYSTETEYLLNRHMIKCNKKNNINSINSENNINSIGSENVTVDMNVIPSFFLHSISEINEITLPEIF